MEWVRIINRWLNINIRHPLPPKIDEFSWIGQLSGELWSYWLKTIKIIRHQVQTSSRPTGIKWRIIAQFLSNITNVALEILTWNTKFHRSTKEYERGAEARFRSWDFFIVWINIKIETNSFKNSWVVLTIMTTLLWCSSATED